VWMIAEAEGKVGKELGYFKVGDRAARAVVPMQLERKSSLK